MIRRDRYLDDRSVTVETGDVKPWDRREFVKGLAALAGSAGLFGLYAESAVAEPPPETKKIRLIHAPAICLSPMYLAEELLRIEGFSDVEYVQLETGTGSPVIASGRADISMWNVPGTILTMDAGKPLVMLAGIHAGCYELFVIQGVGSIRDLKGRTIAIQAFGGGDHVLMSIMLAYVGMHPQERCPMDCRDFDA